jgi:serine protease Do
MKARHWLGLALICGTAGFGLGLGLGRAKNPMFAPAVTPAAFAGDNAPRGAALTPPAASARHTAIVDVAQAVSPAVVSIGVTKTTYVRQYDPFGGDLFFTPYLMTRLKRDFPYLGSGFIIDTHGHVITNYHVVEDSTSIQVTLTDGRSFQARLLDADSFIDVALLEIEGLDAADRLPIIKLGNSDDIMIAESVLAIGNPFGPLLADPRPSVSVGVVSAVNRSIKTGETSDRFYQDMIQTDAAINPGNSGGPLVNLDGEAIGINTFILSRSGDSAGGGFSIPINRAMKIANEIIQFGKLRSIHPGFEMRNLSPFLIQTLHLNATSGALIWSTEVDGPAARAGLEPGDVVIAIDGKPIATAEDLVTTLKLHTVGDRLRLRVKRQEREIELAYAVEEGRAP